MESTLKQPLSNLQLELLRVFSHQLDNDEVRDFKKLLVNFFAQRAVDQANNTWDEKGWSNSDIDQILQTKMRTSKNKSSE